MLEAPTVRLLVVLSLVWLLNGCAAARVIPVGRFAVHRPAAAKVYGIAGGWQCRQPFLGRPAPQRSNCAKLSSCPSGSLRWK